MTAWRKWALTAGALLAGCGLLMIAWGGSWALLIVGIVAMGTALLEPAYGSLVRPPVSSAWQATDERFIDPETGKLVTVWFDSATGERRYVADGDPPIGS